MSLGKRMKERRKSLKMTQQQLADQVGVSQSVVASMESRGYKKSDHAEAIASALHVSLDWLMTGNEESGTVIRHGGSSTKLTDEHYMLIALFSNVSEVNQEMVIRFLQDNQLIAKPQITQLLSGSEKTGNGN